VALSSPRRGPKCRRAGAREHYDHAAGKTYRGGLFKSDDAGCTWRRILHYHFVSCVAVSPADPRVIYAATNDHPYHDDCCAEGVLKSSDGGATWQHENSGLTLTNVKSIAVSPHAPAILYASTGGNGVFTGTDRRLTDMRQGRDAEGPPGRAAP